MKMSEPLILSCTCNRWFFVLYFWQRVIFVTFFPHHRVLVCHLWSPKLLASRLLIWVKGVMVFLIF